MDPEISEGLNRPVLVVPAFTVFPKRTADPCYPGIIFGFPDDKIAPENGTPEILKATLALESAGITCCMVGTSALIYFGAGRIRLANMCTNREARSCIVAPPVCLFKDWFTLSQPPPDNIDIESLLHTFPRFKRNGLWLWFRLIPSEDCHIDCKPSNIERSHRGLPYPKLEVYTQSLIDAYRAVDLTDLVDGMNLSKEWGDEHLDLEGTNDTEWARKKNEGIRKNVPNVDDTGCLYELSEKAFLRREFWEAIIDGKEHRLGWKYPKEYYATRFRLHSQGDPRDCTIRPV